MGRPAIVVKNDALKMLHSGMSPAQIAARFGVKAATIRQIASRGNIKTNRSTDEIYNAIDEYLKSYDLGRLESTWPYFALVKVLEDYLMRRFKLSRQTVRYHLRKLVTQGRIPPITRPKQVGRRNTVKSDKLLPLLNPLPVEALPQSIETALASFGKKHPQEAKLLGAYLPGAVAKQSTHMAYTLSEVKDLYDGYASGVATERERQLEKTVEKLSTEIEFLYQRLAGFEAAVNPDGRFVPKVFWRQMADNYQEELEVLSDWFGDVLESTLAVPHISLDEARETFTRAREVITSLENYIDGLRSYAEEIPRAT